MVIAAVVLWAPDCVLAPTVGEAPNVTSNVLVPPCAAVTEFVTQLHFHAPAPRATSELPVVCFVPPIHPLLFALERGVVFLEPATLTVRVISGMQARIASFCAHLAPPFLCVLGMAPAPAKLECVLVIRM
eukprot:TRINITY_DN29445_c0_g1_i1.p2 TRINITY_DN29445_c0_g1~~TRINITY_DN29445_c0_g1_i1.p2  ORF type:complete len:130 (-),score=8.30 TRINITY_DN29445_c0_g1_i1:84-473(-)